MKIYVLNGPNLNMLGIREPEQYGSRTYADLVGLVEAHCEKKQITAVCKQSNHEGDLVDWIQEAYFEGADGIVINPGAYTHTSIAILDAVKATRLPTVEVHITDIDSREEYRHVSYIREACVGHITGKGFQGYLEAIDMIAEPAGKEAAR